MVEYLMNKTRWFEYIIFNYATFPTPSFHFTSRFMFIHFPKQIISVSRHRLVLYYILRSRTPSMIKLKLFHISRPRNKCNVIKSRMSNINLHKMFSVDIEEAIWFQKILLRFGSNKIYSFANSAPNYYLRYYRAIMCLFQLPFEATCNLLHQWSARVE